MNRGKKILQMRRLINRYGEITEEYRCYPNKFYPPYRKGSYFAAYISARLGFCSAVGDIDKYNVYKELVNEIKDHIVTGNITNF